MSFNIKVLASAILLAIATTQASAANVTLDGDNFTISYDTNVIGLFGSPSLVPTWSLHLAATLVFRLRVKAALNSRTPLSRS